MNTNEEPTSNKSTSNFLPAQWTALNVVDPSFKPSFRKLKAEPAPAKRKAKAKTVTNDKEHDEEESVLAKGSIPGASRRPSRAIHAPQAAALAAEESLAVESRTRASNSSVPATFQARFQVVFAGGEDLSKVQLRPTRVLAASVNFTAARQNAKAPAIARRVSTMDCPTPHTRKRRSSEAAQPQEDQDFNTHIAGYDPIKSVLVADVNGNTYRIPAYIINWYRLDKDQIEDIDNGTNDEDAAHRQTGSGRPEKRVKLGGQMGDTNNPAKSQSRALLAEGNLDRMNSSNKAEDNCIDA